MLFSKYFRGAKGGFVGLILGITAFLPMFSCGIRHTVDGNVDVNVNVDEIVVRVKFFCDKKIDGIQVYKTRDEYRQCVIDTIGHEDEQN